MMRLSKRQRMTLDVVPVPICGNLAATNTGPNSKP
jgi:hypothetical protein